MMKKLFLILWTIIFASCIGPNNEHRLILDHTNIKAIEFVCKGRQIFIDSTDYVDLVNKINTAKHIGAQKGIVYQNMNIYLKSNDTIRMNLNGNKFKWNGSGDWSYQLDLDEKYFEDKCLH